MEISNRLYINSYKPFNPISSKIGEKEETMGYSSMPNCCPAYFSPSFTAMKKREFVGVDNLVVEKYKAPIQMIAAISFQVTLDIIVCIQLCMYRDIGKKGPINIAKKKIEDINKLMKKIDEINILHKKKQVNNAEQIEIKKHNSGEENESEKKDQNNTSDPDTSLK